MAFGRLSLFAAAASLALVATPSLAEPFKLKIACTATSDCASAMVARDQGIFAKHGLDADVTLLADALGYDPRIGRRFLNAGLGFGGGCLPKDIRAFMARAGELGANHALTFLREVDSINMRRRTRMVELATKACGGSLLGANVAVLGAAFKPESDDVRDSPALNVAGMLQLNGATVNVYDPKAMENSQRIFPTLNYSTSVVEACERADAVLVLTEWREFIDLDPDQLADTVRAKVVVDGRNCLDSDRWTRAGWRVYCLGRSIGEPVIA